LLRLFAWAGPGGADRIERPRESGGVPDREGSRGGAGGEVISRNAVCEERPLSFRFLYRPNYHRRLYGMTEVDLSLWIVLAALAVALGSVLTLLR
jgi:hypothetical protein